MKLKDLSPETLEKIAKTRYDEFIEKHEGPLDWRWFIENEKVELMQIEGYHVLLPIYIDDHPHIIIRRTIVSKDEKTLTIFLKDPTYTDDPDWEMFLTGFVAICDKFPNEDFYITIVFHRSYMLNNDF